MYPKAVLEHCVKIEVLNSELTLELSSCCTDTYRSYVQGGKMYNNSRFVDDVKKEIVKREVPTHNNMVIDEVNLPTGPVVSSCDRVSRRASIQAFAI